MEQQSVDTDIALVNKIVSFIKETGLQCREGVLPDNTFLPGLTIEEGCIVYNTEHLLYPGDMIHEAGHLAVLLPEDRAVANGDNMCGDLSAPGVEMSAIAWSWAAMKHMGLAPEILFHKHGYAGGSESLITAFSSGSYIGLPVLQWLGMTKEPKKGVEADEYTYPKMRHWLRREGTGKG